MSSQTIQDTIDGGFITTAYCLNRACDHRAVLDWIVLRDRLGPNHGAMRDDILPKLVCSKCGGRNVDIMLAPDPKKTNGMSAEGNAYWAKKMGR